MTLGAVICLQELTGVTECESLLQTPGDAGGTKYKGCQSKLISMPVNY